MKSHIVTGFMVFTRNCLYSRSVKGSAQPRNGHNILERWFHHKKDSIVKSVDGQPITIFWREVSIMKSSIGFHWSGQSLEMVSVFRGENNCERARCNAAGHPGDNYAQY